MGDQFGVISMLGLEIVESLMNMYYFSFVISKEHQVLIVGVNIHVNKIKFLVSISITFKSNKTFS